MSVENDLTYWTEALAGKRPPVVEDQPQCGYYRMRKGRDAPWLPVVIWIRGGEMVARVGDNMREPLGIWVACAKHPVAKDAAMHAFKVGSWPDMPDEPPASNMPSDPFEALLAEIADKQAQAEALLAKGNKASSETESNLARNLQKQLLDLQKRADAMFTQEKAPVVQQGREIDEKYRFRVPLKGFADRLRDFWGRWAKAEEDRLRREAEEKAANERRAIEAARKAQEEHRAKLMESDPIAALTEPPIPEVEPAAEPEPVKVQVGGGYGSRGGLRSYWVPTIVDYKAALAHYAEHPDIKAVVDKLVKAEARTHKGATNIPGVTVSEDRRAA